MRGSYRSTGAFLEQLARLVRERLPAELADFETRPGPALVKLFSGDPAVHYEAWLHRSRGRLELGLHFERRDAAANARDLARLSADLLLVKAAVSAAIEAEPWDKGWTRIYEVVPLEPLSPAYAERIADRWARLIAVLEPLRRAAG